MKKGFCISTIVITLLAGSLFILPASTGKARASGWEWRQDDWTGGPGQALWTDNARYSTSSGVDTTSVPGTLRLSHIANPYLKEATNPVLHTGGAGAWDENLISAAARPYAGGGYEALYQAGTAAGVMALGYASTPEGVHWSKYFDNPVLAGDGSGAWEARGVGAGPLIQEEGINYLWFSGYDNVGNTHYGYATSPDLINWSRLPDYVFGPGPAGAWDQTIHVENITHAGDEYRMYYSGVDAANVTRVGYATSPDGITWTRNPGNPILQPGAAGAWDASGVGALSVLERPWAGDYYMAFTGVDSLGNTGIGIATSPDGIHWNKHAGNPVLVQGGAGSFTEKGMRLASLNFDGSFYRIILQGSNAGNVVQTGEAYSFDGLGWTLQPVTLPAGGVGSWDQMAAMANRDYLDGGLLRIFYTGASATNFAMGTATAVPNYAGLGWLESSVFDAGSASQWGNVTWRQELPAGTSVTFEVRAGNVSVPDGSWTAWAAVAMGGAVPHAASRYLQYRVSLNSGGADVTPIFSDLSIDFTALPSTWYFAEGYTGPGFDQWITVQNSNPGAADLTLTYYTPTGPPQVRNHSVPGQSRLTINVNSDLGENLENSCEISSTLPVIVERPMYYDYAGTAGHDWQGGDVVMGSTGLSRAWYFAEGYTGDGFDEWLTIQNPGASEATVNVTYFINGDQPIEKRHVVKAASRYTINVNEDAGAGLELSCSLEADQPILAERPMYFNYSGHISGGHIVMGSTMLSDVWYLAEGATFPPFTEYLTIQNPGDVDADLIVTYYRSAGGTTAQNHVVPARSRYTINVGDDSGWSAEVSVMVGSSQPILAERPMYFDLLDGGEPGGHCSMGVQGPSTDWYFGEGYTGPGFDEWLTLQNPFPAPVVIEVTYYTESGAPINRTHTVPGESRYTINVNSDAGDDLQLSAHVHSTGVPIIAERPMYFFYQGYSGYNWPGGSCTAGFAP